MAGAESAVSSAVNSLANLLAQEVRLPSGMRGPVEWVQTELRRMECFLKYTDSSSIEGNETMKKWRRELRDLANSAEDASDTFILRGESLRVESLRRGGGCFGMLRCVYISKEVAARHKVASEIADIKLKLSSISDGRPTYGIEFIGPGADATASLGGRIFKKHRLSSPSIPAETDFVGFANKLPQFITRLTSEEPKRRCIFSVVGKGGLGKTTFATKVYSDSRVKEHFEKRAWVSVSRQYAATDIYSPLQRCLKQLPDAAKKTADQMREEISNYLKGKRYLLVLDDVWTKESWDHLKEAFPDSGNGSRVLLATRIQEVASHADPQIKPLNLTVLNRDESWDLFCKKTFPEHKNCCPPDFEEVGRQIVGKCGGLPGAIVAAGGILEGKSKPGWKQLLKSIDRQFDDQGEAGISGILNLIYKDLPYGLKPCFLYLGIFPEDEELRTKQLIHMWAAEGLLQQRGDETVEEVGEDCVRALVRRRMRALVRRRMIQVAETSSTGGIKSCRIHDLFRDIAISEAKGDEFLWRADIALSSSAKACRLAIHCNSDSIDKCISWNSAVSHLRSMFIYSQDYAYFGGKLQKSLYSRCKLLRVLYLHNVMIFELPSEIGDLIHLRYFGCVGGTELRSLPPSIGNLRSLQTLRIDSIRFIKTPRAIEKMQELRHLQVTRTRIAMVGVCGGFFNGQPRLEQISNLHTLKHVKAGKWLHNSLGKLKSSLRKLGISLHSDAYYQSIAQLESLQSLSLASPPFNAFIGEEVTKIPNLVPLAHLLQLRKLSLRGKLVKLPWQSEFPPKLTKLTLSYSCLEQDPVATLEKLQNLRILRLLKDSYMGKEMKCSAEGFPSLEYLRLESLPDLDKWIIEEGAMRRLEHLRITNCGKLKMLPEGVKHLRALKKLEVLDMPGEFKATLRTDARVDRPLYKVSIDFL